MKRRIYRTTILALLLGALALTVLGATPKVGEPGPNFALMDTDSKVVRLSNLVGQQKTVLVFFRTLH